VIPTGYCHEDLIKPLPLKYIYFFQKSFRKYPLGGILMRECTKNYTLPESDVKIRVGDQVLVPVYGLDHDPKYFPDPDVFDPERFTEEAKKDAASALLHRFWRRTQAVHW
jgi:cytochrome P450